MSIRGNEVINDRIIELLEQGTIPWRKPWNDQSNYRKRGYSVAEAQENAYHQVTMESVDPFIIIQYVNNIDNSYVPVNL